MRPVVFLDRDGTLNEEVGYIRDLSALRLIPGAGDAVRRLNQAGVAAVLVTNQTGAARGYYPESHILALNHRLEELLSTCGARLDASYYCPHLAEGSVEPFARACSCRKPEPGMVHQAYEEHRDLDPARSYVVGDKSSDVALARNCGARAVLLRTGYGEQVLAGTYQWHVEPDFTAPDIGAAVDWILEDLGLSSSAAG